MNRNVKFVIGAAVVLFLSAGRPMRAEIAISITPMRVDLKLVPGAVVNDTMTITNTGDQAVRIKVSIQDWDLTFQGNPVFAAAKPDASFSCSRWMQINPVDFRLGTGQQRTIRYAVTVPPEAPAQGYRSAILCEIIPDVLPGAKKKVQIKGQIAMIVYGIVGSPVPFCEIQDLKTEINSGKVEIVLKLKNKSQVHFRTRGKIDIRDEKGRKVGEAVIPDVPTLPESEREIRIPFAGTLPPGEYELEAVVDIGLKEMVGARSKWIIR